MTNKERNQLLRNWSSELQHGATLEDLRAKAVSEDEKSLLEEIGKKPIMKAVGTHGQSGVFTSLFGMMRPEED